MEDSVQDSIGSNTSAQLNQRIPSIVFISSCSLFLYFRLAFTAVSLLLVPLSAYEAEDSELCLLYLRSRIWVIHSVRVSRERTSEENTTTS